MTLKGGTASSLVLKGRNVAAQGLVHLPTGIAAALAGSTRATVQIHGTGLPQCFSATVDRVIRADTDLFKARR